MKLEIGAGIVRTARVEAALHAVDRRWFVAIEGRRRQLKKRGSESGDDEEAWADRPLGIGT